MNTDDFIDDESAPAALDEIERQAREWAGEDADWYPGVGPKVTLALIARIRELEAGAARAVTIADEAFGLGPVEPLDWTLARIERGIAAEHIRNATLEAIARAAIAFVDEQGPRASEDLLLHPDFASAHWEDLVRAVEGAGR